MRPAHAVSLAATLVLGLTSCAGSKPTEKPVVESRQHGPCNDLEPCLKRCEAGDETSCTRAGLWSSLLSVDKLAPFKERVLAAVSGRCQADEARGCTYLGSLSCAPVEDGLDCNADAVAALDKACELGDGTGCVFAANAYGPTGVAKRSVPEDEPRARKLYGRGLGLLKEQCQARDLFSCSGLTEIYRGGHGLAPDEQQAAESAKATLPIATDACDAEDALGCFLAGTILGEGMGVAADVERASSYLRHACRMSPLVCAE